MVLYYIFIPCIKVEFSATLVVKSILSVICFIFRKLSFLSLRSLKLSPSPDRKLFLKESLSTSPSNPTKSTQAPQPRRKSIMKLLRRSSIFNHNKEEDSETEDIMSHPPPPKFLGQIYRNAKLKLSRSFASISSFSQVGSELIFDYKYPKNTTQDPVLD